MTRQLYHSDHFTGANVTVSIGPCILTQIAGIQYQVENSRRPIYGYNSSYFDVLCKGTVACSGNMWLNFVSPQYLTLTIHRFYQTMYAFLNAIQSSNTQALQDELSINPALADIFTSMGRRYDLPQSAFHLDTGENLDIRTDDPYSYNIEVAGAENNFNTGNAFSRPEYLSSSNSTANEQDFATLLDELFESQSGVSGLNRLIWGDSAGSTGSGAGMLRSHPPALETSYSIGDMASSAASLLSSLSYYARPDQLSHPIDGYVGIDITILYGNPYDSNITDKTLQYDTPAARILKDVHFLGEGQSIMTDGNVLVDSYPFIARNVHSFSDSYGNI